MLIHEYDLEKNFDMLLHKAYPFLIYLPSEKRDELADLQKALIKYYKDKWVTDFQQQAKRIEDFLEGLELTPSEDMLIFALACETSTVYSKFQALHTRISALEKKQGKGKKIKPDKIQTLNNILAGNIAGKKTPAAGEKTNIDIIVDFLKITKGPVTVEEISQAVQLTPSQVYNALDRVFRRKRALSSRIKKGKLYREQSGAPLATFEWTGLEGPQDTEEA